MTATIGKKPEVTVVSLDRINDRKNPLNARTVSNFPSALSLIPRACVCLQSNNRRLFGKGGKNSDLLHRSHPYSY